MKRCRYLGLAVLVALLGCSGSAPPEDHAPTGAPHAADGGATGADPRTPPASQTGETETDPDPTDPRTQPDQVPDSDPDPDSDSDPDPDPDPVPDPDPDPDPVPDPDPDPDPDPVPDPDLDADDDAGLDVCAPDQECQDAGDCDSRTLELSTGTLTQPGNLLLIYDRSGSMADTWNGTTRWEAAGGAIQNALAALDVSPSVGAFFFPSPDPDAPLECVDPTGLACIFVPTLMVQGGTCGVGEFGAGDQIDFMPVADFLMRFAGAPNSAPPYAPIPGSQTPLGEALQAVDAGLATAMLSGHVSVLLVTDGDPNCEWNAAASQQLLGDWRSAGITTYVVGIPGTDPATVTTLNDLASAAGTTALIAEDAAALEQRVAEIVQQHVQTSVASCVIGIDEPAGTGDLLHLVVTRAGTQYEVPRQLGAGAGWTLNPDATAIELTGELCSAAQSGELERLAVELGCVDLPLLPSP